MTERGGRERGNDAYIHDVPSFLIERNGLRYKGTWERPIYMGDSKGGYGAHAAAHRETVFWGLGDWGASYLWVFVLYGSPRNRSRRSGPADLGESRGMNSSHSQTSHLSLNPQLPKSHQHTAQSPSGRGW